MLPVFSFGACCSACRCGNEKAHSTSEVWCPSSSGGILGDGAPVSTGGGDKAQMAAGVIGDEMTIETPGLEKEWCKTACCFFSLGCLHPKTMGCLGCASQQSGIFSFPYCCLAICCCSGSSTTMCKMCTCEDLNSYCSTSQSSCKDCDCSGDNKFPYCIFDECSTGRSCCCGLIKGGCKSKDGFFLCKETGICSQVCGCGLLPFIPGCVQRTNCPFCCVETNDQKCMVALLGCVLYPACHHDLCKTHEERAAILNVDTRSWEERNPEKAAAAASSHLGSKKQDGGLASIGSSMAVMTQPGATTMNPAYDFGGSTENGGGGDDGGDDGDGEEGEEGKKPEALGDSVTFADFGAVAVTPVALPAPAEGDEFHQSYLEVGTADDVEATPAAVAAKKPEALDDSLTSADLDANDTPAADLGFSDSDSESEDSVAASEDEETAEPAASVVIEEATISKQPTESAEKEAAAADVAATKKETYSKKEGGAKEKSDPAPSSPAVEEKASKKKKKASTKKKSGEDVSSAAAAAPKKKKKKVATKKGKVTVSMAAPFGIGLEEDGEAGVKVGIVKEGKKADKTGKIKVGMKIVSINGISTVGLAKKEVSGLIKDCKGAGPVPIVFER